jgi:hypothetical protein
VTAMGGAVPRQTFQKHLGNWSESRPPCPVHSRIQKQTRLQHKKDGTTVANVPYARADAVPRRPSITVLLLRGRAAGRENRQSSIGLFSHTRQSTNPWSERIHQSPAFRLPRFGDLGKEASVFFFLSALPSPARRSMDGGRITTRWTIISETRLWSTWVSTHLPEGRSDARGVGFGRGL